MAERDFEAVLEGLNPEQLERSMKFVMAQGELPTSPEAREELETQREILERYIAHETAAPDAAHLSQNETLQEIVRRQADICDALASSYLEEERALRESLGTGRSAPSR